MPSGAKKRKAAKKKKEQEANISSSTNSHGNDDQKTQDEKESDSGEVSSPVSLDHNNHQDNPFNDTSTAGSVVAENKSMEVKVMPNDEEDRKEDAEGEGIVQTFSKLNTESENVSIKHVEYKTKVHDGSSSSSSSSSSSRSSSDDESRVVEKNSLVLESDKVEEEAYNSVLKGNSLLQEAENMPAGDTYVSIVETGQSVDSVEAVESVPEKVIPITESVPTETSVNSNTAELSTKENNDQLLPSLDENGTASLSGMDSESKKIEAKVFPLSHENAGGSSSAKDVVLKESENNLVQSPGATIIETSNGVEHTKNSEIPECSENQPLVAVAPRPVQTNSWKSCCGLFDVLTGSG